MIMLLLLLRLLITIGIAFLVGKLVSKIKLPSILGWLISGMLLGPYALSVMNQEVLDRLVPGFGTHSGMQRRSDDRNGACLEQRETCPPARCLLIFLNLGAPLDYHLIMGAERTDFRLNLHPVCRRRNLSTCIFPPA